MRKRILCILTSICMLLCLTSCFNKKSNSELFLETQENFLKQSLMEYEVLYEDLCLYGNINTESKNATINLSSSKKEPVISLLIKGNELYVDLASVSNFIKNTYQDDEQMLLIAETLDTQYFDYKYLKIKISETDIWDNILSVKTTVPEGDFRGLYLIINKILNQIDMHIAENDIESPSTIVLDNTFINQVIDNISLEIETNKTDYEGPINTLNEIFQTIAQENFDNNELDNLIPQSITLDLANNQYKITTENISILFLPGKEFELPEDLDSFYDIDRVITDPVTLNLDVEIDNEEYVELLSDDSEVEDDSIYGLIKLIPENFKDIIGKTLIPIGFEELSSTEDSIEMVYNGKYKYLVTYKNNSIILNMETQNIDSISDFSNEFVNCAISVLGLKFDEYTINSDLQETYNDAINMFANTKQKIYNKTGTINNTKIQYIINNIEDKGTISIEVSRNF